MNDAENPMALTIWDSSVPNSDGTGTIITSILYYVDSMQETLVALNLKTGEKRIIRNNVPDIVQLKLYQKPEATSSATCLANNGDCHQICLPSKKAANSRICRCSNGLELQIVDGSCRPYQSFILYATSGAIRAMPLEKSNQIGLEGLDRVEALPIVSDSSPSRLDFDYRTRSVFWIEEQRLVKVMSLNFSWVSTPGQDSSNQYVSKKVNLINS